MQNILKWLKQANAKTTLALAVCVLFATAAFSAWQFVSPADSEEEDETGANRVPPPSTTPTLIGLVKHVNRRLNAEITIPVNPFSPSLGSAGAPPNRIRNPNPADPQNPNSGWKTQGGGTSGTGGTTTGIKDPAVPPKPPAPVFSYKGYMTRPDGTPLALIHNSATGATRFYAANETLADVLFTAVSHESLTLTFPNGDEHTLLLHETITIQ
jgi:hypothetical protein